MPEKKKMRTCVGVAAGALLALAGCGGGSTTDSPPPVADADRDGVADPADCAPQDPKAWQMLSFASRNEDGDVARVNVSGQVCAGASLPANRFAASVPAGEVDCDDADPNGWTLREYAGVDADGDGYAVPAAGSKCSGAALTAGFLTVAPTVARTDCDDHDPTHWNWHAIYRDADGDGVGAGAATFACLGSGNPAAGYSVRGYDPDDRPGDPGSAAISELALASHQLTVVDDVDEDDTFP